MLSQSDSTASTNLHRSKSTTSVKERRKHPLPPEPPDPEQSRIHALIAAHRAMDRSQSRSSGDLGRADSNASRRTAAASGRDGHIQFSPATQLRKQRSVLHSRAPHLSTALRAPPQTKLDSHQAEAALVEFGSISENYGAEPSSYRKIRRTRSLLTPRRRLFSNHSSPHNTPFSQAPTLRNAASNMALADSGLKLRLKRSLNALRPGSRLSIPHRPETHIGHHDEVVQMAREQYLNDMQEDTLRQRPSAIFNPKVRYQQKPFRKSVRTRHAHETESLITSDHQASETTKSESKKRSFSATLRDRFKRAFGVSASHKPSIPPQQLEASRQHFGDDMGEEIVNTSFDNYIVDEEESRRQSFYVPSKAGIEDQEELDRFSPTLHDAASRESLHSNARSRVTSWTNSTVTAGSVSTRGPALERNRLSIIKEDGGPHQPSSSAGRHLGGIHFFQDALDTEDENGQELPGVDSQRIYSALMKRIGEEEVEIEQTEAALHQIQNGQTRASHNPLASIQSTIRAVSSTTVETLAGDESDPHFRQQNVSPAECTSGMTQKMHKHNVDRRRAKLASQEEQSSFFPFSGEEQSNTPSPFRRLLQERRSQGESDDSLTDLHPVGTARKNDDQRSLGRGRFGLSKESIYSRTTDGGLNASYQRPLGSSEGLASPTQEAIGDSGMATIIPTQYHHSVDTRAQLPSSAGSSEKREWSGWMKDQMDALSRTDSKASHHRRELAQIDPDDVEVGNGHGKRPPSRSSAANRFPLLDLKEVPRNNTPAPKRSSSLTKSQSGLLKRVSSIGLNSTLRKNDENRKASNGVRKVSPGNIARMLKERKSQILTSWNDEKDKENSPTLKGESPPVSTPGRLHLQMRSGNGRLRKRTSEMGVGKDQNTPKEFSTPHQPKTGDYDESPTDRIKQSLSARLSRPFNMDVPAENRPFDSMYLGKREGGIPDTRLSVAPNPSGATRGPKGYGGLGPSPFQADTALPEVPTPSNGAEKMKGALG